MSADTAIGIGNDLPSGHTRICKGTADHESTGGIDQRFEIGVQTVLLCRVLHDPQHNIMHIFGADVLCMLRGNQEGVDAALSIVEGDLALGIRAQAGSAASTQVFQRLASQHIRQRKHLPCFIGCIAEHHTLIPGSQLLFTIAINALGDVRALAGNVYGKVVLGQILVGTVAEQHMPGKCPAVRLVPRGDLAGNADFVALDHALHSHTAVAVMLETVGHNGIRDLVTDFVGVPAGHLFTGE